MSYKKKTSEKRRLLVEYDIYRRNMKLRYQRIEALPMRTIKGLFI